MPMMDVRLWKRQSKEIVFSFYGKLIQNANFDEMMELKWFKNIWSVLLSVHSIEIGFGQRKRVRSGKWKNCIPQFACVCKTETIVQCHCMMNGAITMTAAVPFYASGRNNNGKLWSGNLIIMNLRSDFSFIHFRKASIVSVFVMRIIGTLWTTNADRDREMALLGKWKWIRSKWTDKQITSFDGKTSKPKIHHLIWT